MKCALCEADGPLFNANRECCQIRALANAPTERRAAALLSIKETKGKTEANRIMELTNAERRARKERGQQKAKLEIHNMVSSRKGG